MYPAQKKKNFKVFLAQFAWIKTIYSFYLKLKGKIYLKVLGEHPKNTIFSFNYHNVRHINSYLSLACENLTGNKNIIVDVGSGNSPYYEIFAHKFAKYIAVDLPQSLPKIESRSIKQISGLAENIPLEDCVCDVVICNQALEHVQDSVKSVSQIFRILQPGGKFIGSVPHISPVHLEPYDFRRYTDLGVKQLLENAGFIDINIEGNGGVYSTVALILAMDWMLSIRKEERPQKLLMFRALLLAPLVGFLNAIAIVLDRFLGDKKRTPANLCWTATKPIHN